MSSRILFSRLPKPISCRVLAPLLTQFVEAESTLTPSERAAVDAHLSACPACFEEREGVRVMGDFLRERGPAAMPGHVPAPDLWDRIESRMVTEQRESRRSFSMRPVLLFAPALAAVAVVVVLMPKGTVSPTSNGSQPVLAKQDSHNLMAGTVASESAKASAPMVTMDEALTMRPSPAPLLAPRPSAMRAKVQQPPMRIVMVEKLRNRMPASVAFRRTQSSGFGRTVNVALAPRDSSRFKKVAPSLARPKEEFATITIVDVDTKPAPTMVAIARMSAPEPRPVAPVFDSVAGASRHTGGSVSDVASRTITVVNSIAGSGVSTTAYSPPQVTDTMNRQRQRLGLFRGYGVGGATMGVLPGTGSGSGSGTASPW